MYIKTTHLDHGNMAAIQAVCPFCGVLGTFLTLHNAAFTIPDGAPPLKKIAFQTCPSRQCLGLLLIIMEGQRIVKTYPGIGRSINTENVPDRVREAFREGADCFANQCYVASAILIRKTLEELCADKGATGGNLYQKITNLGTQMTIPTSLIEAMHNLRLLGNDAAHLESQTYNQIGPEELELSIDVTQKIITSVYQLGDILSRFESLKRTAVEPPTE